MKIGDGVARVTKMVGIQPCASCEERRKFLNSFGERMAKVFGRAEEPPLDEKVEEKTDGE